jgi:hypothetical protein
MSLQQAPFRARLRRFPKTKACRLFALAVIAIGLFYASSLAFYSSLLTGLRMEPRHRFWRRWSKRSLLARPRLRILNDILTCCTGAKARVGVRKPHEPRHECL